MIDIEDPNPFASLPKYCTVRDIKAIMKTIHKPYYYYTILLLLFSSRAKEDIIKYSPEEKRQLVRAIDNMFASKTSPFLVLPEHCTVGEVEASSIETIHRSFNSSVLYSGKAYMAMANRLTLSGL